MEDLLDRHPPEWAGRSRPRWATPFLGDVLKRCTKCGLEMSIECYYRDTNHGRDCPRSECKPCFWEAQAERWDRVSELKREHTKRVRHCLLRPEKVDKIGPLGHFLVTGEEGGVLLDDVEDRLEMFAKGNSPYRAKPHKE